MEWYKKGCYRKNINIRSDVKLKDLKFKGLSHEYDEVRVNFDLSLKDVRNIYTALCDEF